MNAILFVDDDPNVLHGLRDSLRRNRRVWQMEFANGPHEALEILASKTFDIVVSDMRMPDMDGAGLLEEVRRTHPGCARVVLSGHSEREQLIRASAVAHQYLGKPCSGEVLKATLSALLAARERIASTAVNEAVGRIQSLSSVGALQQELMQSTAQNGSRDEALCVLLEKDSALMMRIVEIIGIAFPESSGSLNTAAELVSAFGFERIRSIAILARICADLERHGSGAISTLEFQQHAAWTGRLAEACCTVDSDKEHAFVAGTLHDIGQVVNELNNPDLYAQLLTLEQQSGRSLQEIEIEHLGFDHAQTGALLLDYWGMPAPVAIAVQQHHWAGSPNDGPGADDGFGNAVIEANALSRWLEQPHLSASPHCTPDVARIVEMLRDPATTLA